MARSRKKKWWENHSPRSVAMVGLGPTSQEFFASAATKKGFLDVDEVWVVNSGISVLDATYGWIMDDLKHCESEYPEWTWKMRTLDIPLVTCRAYPEYKTAVEYPLEEVCDFLQDDYFTTTPAYMVGYAMFRKIQDVFIYGMDFWYPGGMAYEHGSACVAYLLGVAREKGMNYKIPQTSTLLDAHLCQFEDLPDGSKKRRRKLYGYDWNPGEAAKAVERGHATPLQKDVAQRVPHRLAEAAQAMPDNSQLKPKPATKKETDAVVANRKRLNTGRKRRVEEARA